MPASRLHERRLPLIEHRLLVAGRHVAAGHARASARLSDASQNPRPGFIVERRARGAEKEESDYRHYIVSGRLNLEDFRSR
eukprot:3121344-Prymnesium_polylepis.1